MRKRWQAFWIVLFLAAYAFVLSRAWGHPETKLLPIYAVASVSRLIVTYFICLIFGVTVGIFTAMNKVAGDIIIPLLDILQSVPILGFFPFAVLLIVPIFGLGIASMVLLFTSMAWSIVFGVIAGVRSIPQHIQDMAAIFNIRGWQYIKNIVLPSIYAPLIAGSILAFGSGWYFLIASEFVTYGTRTYTLPGLGYYLNVASFAYANIWMSLAGLLTIALIVFLFHRLVWIKLDKNSREAKFLTLHFGYEKTAIDLPQHSNTHPHHTHHRVHFNRRHAHQWFFNIFKPDMSKYISVLAVLFIIGLSIVLFGKQNLLLTPSQLLWFLLLSFMRILIAYIFAVTIAVTIGYILIKNPGSRKVIMPMADVMQSIPALAYFPIIYLLLATFLSIGLTLEIASILLLLTGMLWYLIFNVIEAVERLPEDINAVSKIYRIKGGEYVRDVLVPAMFPALVTGSILAFGGGWNAIMVSEYVNIGGQVHSIAGIGSAMNAIAGTGNTATMLAILLCITGIVLLLNHLVWRKLLNHASKYILEED